MLTAGDIEPSTSQWTFHIVSVRKKDGTVRMCIGYLQLNQVTEDDVYQMPRVDDLIEQLGTAAYISTLELRKGYYQIVLKPEDKVKTAFSSPVGKFQFTRMPFGLKGAPATFQKLIDSVLAPRYVPTSMTSLFSVIHGMLIFSI